MQDWFKTGETGGIWNVAFAFSWTKDILKTELSKKEGIMIIIV